VFFKRTIRPYVVPTSTDDPFEALQISQNERGKVDIAYMEELTGKDYDKELVEKANSNLRKKQTDTAILKRRAYFILDEFGNLPKMENIEGMVTVGRSRGIRYLFVLQSFSQLNAKYGRDIGDIVKTNCNVFVS